MIRRFYEILLNIIADSVTYPSAAYSTLRLKQLGIGIHWPKKYYSYYPVIGISYPALFSSFAITTWFNMQFYFQFLPTHVNVYFLEHTLNNMIGHICFHSIENNIR